MGGAIFKNQQVHKSFLGPFYLLGAAMKTVSTPLYYYEWFYAAHTVVIRTAPQGRTIYPCW